MTTWGSVTADAFRDVMSRVCTPVSVVTARDGQGPHGTTVSAFASLSLEPPMVLVALDRGSDLLGLVRSTGLFALNVLNCNQADLALRFARKGSDKFTDVDWDRDEMLPRLHGVCGWLACKVDNIVDGGDHVVVLGSVTQARVGAGEPPLTYHGRTFGTHSAIDVAE